METSSLQDPVIGAAYNLLNDQSPILVKDSNGNKLYIDTITVVVNSNQPTLLIVTAPF